MKTKTARKVNMAKEEFKFLVKKGEVREEKSGHSLAWAGRVENKKKEMNAEGIWMVKSVRGVPESHCEFCNHMITWKFRVESCPTDGSLPMVLEIGSECVRYFTSLEAVIEILLLKIRNRKYVLDTNLRARKLYDYLKENKDTLSKQVVDWNFYNKESKSNPVEVLLGMLRKEKKPRVLERAMERLGIDYKNADWYKFTKDEEKLRLDVRDIEAISGNDISWKLEDKDFPAYPSYFPVDFA